MGILVAFVAVISVVGALPPVDDLFVKCTPPSYTARMFDALKMRVVSTSVDSDRSLSLIQSDDGDWVLTDYQEGVVYQYDKSNCTRARLPKDQVN
ncbi:hypothetical protein PoB_005632500 [Plakobranchus ocellatus]|uniref:Uncharacterized protein n=1 Tax=Plakobranchus ocellatus TaxID=259542 RepID=A0AAV4CEE6_9GAST|nr:hypothetical protein PoB_005632500 [Plakobranchus ocellatus]